MNCRSSNSAPEINKNRCESDFFVGQYNPFIGIYNPLNLPLVGQNRPNAPIRTKHQYQVHGFTLIELVVAMAVAAILVMVAIPSFRTFVQNSRIIAQTNDLLADISFARSRKGGGLCSSTIGTLCDGAGNWTNGRLVWLDADGDGVYDPGEEVRFRQLLEGGNTLTINIPAADPLDFNALAVPIGAAANGVRFRICDSRGTTFGREVVMNPVGQAHSEGPGVAACP